MVTGNIAVVPVVLTHTGIGMKRAARGCHCLFAHQPVTHLLCIGIAGGLTPGLSPADLLLARDVMHSDGQMAPPPDPAWLQQALRVDELVAGTLVTHSRVAGTPKEKTALRELCRSDENACVDMETAAFASAAAKRRVPYLALRAVSDSANEPLPGILTQVVEPGGNVAPLTILRFVFTDPRGGVALVRLGFRFRRCTGRLAVAAERLIRAMV